MFNMSDDTLVLQRAQQILRDRISTKPTMKSQDDVKEFLRVLYSGMGHEEFHVLFMDGGARVVAEELFGRGNDRETVTDTKGMVRRALELGAEGIILSHNHPNGSSNEPSDADIQMTDSVARALDLFGIRLLDHYIVSETGVQSMREHMQQHHEQHHHEHHQRMMEEMSRTLGLHQH